MEKDILSHFDNVDMKIANALRRMPEFPVLTHMNPDGYFWDLCQTIIYQQLSGKAATTICKRFEALFDGVVTPEKLINISHEAMRVCGLSNSKAQYVRNIANAVLSGDIVFSDFDKLSDEDIILKLIAIKGVGRWTAEMFLIFTMGRENIFSYGDLGLKNGLKIVYGWSDLPIKSDLQKIVDSWSPYKTYASLALWASVDLQK